jgi:lysophospholipase L1-like esterase
MTTKRKLFVAVLGVIMLLVVAVGGLTVMQVRGELARLVDDDPAVWLPAIEAFEARDLSRPPAPGGIVFTGSSSIRFWRELEADLAPLPVIRRGFGGARMSDMVHYVDRVVLPYRPSVVVLFAGTNDLAGFSSDGTPEEIRDGWVRFTSAVHAELPEARIYFLSITPTRMRWKHWPEARRANELVAAQARTDERLGYIDATDHFLAQDGRPDPRFFRFDRLHLNRRGYGVWASVIRPVLEAEPVGQSVDAPGG